MQFLSLSVIATERWWLFIVILRKLSFLFVIVKFLFEGHLELFFGDRVETSALLGLLLQLLHLFQCLCDATFLWLFGCLFLRLGLLNRACLAQRHYELILFLILILTQLLLWFFMLLFLLYARLKKRQEHLLTCDFMSKLLDPLLRLH